MPSTYSSSLRLELQATGENANTWGVKTNNNLNLIEQAIAGYVKITLVSASATYNLDIADASASNGRNAFIEFVGTAASAISIVVPDVEKGYWVKNSVTGASLTFRTSGGTGFTLPTNTWVLAVADGASVTQTSTDISQVALASVSGTATLDLTKASYFSAYVAGSTTFAFSNPVKSPYVDGFVLKVTNGGAHTVTWPSAVDWPDGTIPTLSSGTDTFTFISDNGGTDWTGVQSIKNSQ